jgi:hypothetical protein
MTLDTPLARLAIGFPALAKRFPGVSLHLYCVRQDADLAISYCPDLDDADLSCHLSFDAIYSANETVYLVGGTC